MSPSPPPQAHRSSHCSSPVSSHLSEEDEDDGGAPRSDTATVGSNSVIGDIDSIVASTEPPPVALLPHEAVSSRTGQQRQLPPLYPVAQMHAFVTAATTTSTFTHRAFTGTGMPPPERHATVGGRSEETRLPLDAQRSSTTSTTTTDPHPVERLARVTGNIAAAGGGGGGGGSQSGTSSIKSCGSITGSDTDERGEAILSTVGLGLSVDAADAHNTDSDDDNDCGGSLDVEAHSVATMRSLHSQLFLEDDHSTSADAASAAALPASTPSSPRESLDTEQKLLEQSIASSLDDPRNEPAMEASTFRARYRSRSPDLDESLGKSSRARRSQSHDDNDSAAEPSV